MDKQTIFLPPQQKLTTQKVEWENSRRSGLGSPGNFRVARGEAKGRQAEATERSEGSDKQQPQTSQPAHSETHGRQDTSALILLDILRRIDTTSKRNTNEICRTTTKRTMSTGSTLRSKTILKCTVLLYGIHS